MQVLRQFIDEHRHTHGVEPICKVLQIAPSGYRRHAAQQRNPDLRCVRAKTDDTLKPEIQRVWQANMRVYGADKVYKQMRRERIRAKVEHPFRVVKRQFGYVKVRYRGLKKNTAQLVTLFALSNLWMVRGKLMGAQE